MERAALVFPTRFIQQSGVTQLPYAKHYFGGFPPHGQLNLDGFDLRGHAQSRR
jgi:hypothetical protein